MGIENPVHLLFLAAVALVVFGPKRLPELARAAGKGMREFRESLNGEGAEEEPAGQAVVDPAHRYVPRMRLIVARCEVSYVGRLTTALPEAVRLLMLKADGTFMVWADGGGPNVKPLNWMTPPTVLEEQLDADGALVGLVVRPGRARASSARRIAFEIAVTR